MKITQNITFDQSVKAPRLLKAALVILPEFGSVTYKVVKVKDKYLYVDEQITSSPPLWKNALKVIAGICFFPITIPLIIAAGFIKLRCNIQSVGNAEHLKIILEDRPNNPEIFQSILPGLQALADREPEQLVDVLSTKNSFGYTPLHNSAIFRPALPWLQTLAASNPELLSSLLSIKNSLGDTPLHQIDIFDKALPLLQTLAASNPEQLVELLSLTDGFGNTPLHYRVIFQHALPWLKTLAASNPDLVVRLLSMTDRDGNTPLYNSAIFQQALPWLKELAELNSDMVFSLLSMKTRAGYTPLHNSAIFQQALPWLQTLAASNLELVFGLLSIKNSRGNTPLHTSAIFQEALPLLQTLAASNPDLVVRLLSMKTRAGYTPLHYSVIFQHALPWLQTLAASNPELVFSLLSITDSVGDTPLHQIDIFDKALPLLKTLAASNPELVCSLLSIKNSFGDTALHINFAQILRLSNKNSFQQDLRPTISLLKPLEAKNLDAYNELLATRNKLGSTPLLFSNCLSLDEFPKTIEEFYNLSEHLDSAIRNPQESQAALQMLDEIAKNDPDIFLIIIAKNFRLFNEISPLLRQILKGADYGNIVPRVARFLTRNLQDDDPDFDLAVSLADIDPNDKSSPLAIHRQLLDWLDQPCDIHPKPCFAGGTQALLSLEGLQTQAEGANVTLDMLPKDATKANWDTLRLGLKQKFEASGILKNKYPDFEKLWQACLNDPLFQTSLEFPQDAGPISSHQAQWAALLHWILSLDKSSSDANTLSLQEETLYNLAFSFVNCPVGKKENIAARYRDLPQEFKLGSQALSGDATLEEEGARKFIFRLVTDRIGSLIQDDWVVSSLTGTKSAQHVHVTQYIRNAIGPLVGLGKKLVYDPYGIGKVDIDRDTLLERFLRHLTPQALVQHLVEQSSEHEFQQNAMKLIPQSILFWEFNDNDLPVRLTERGALELLCKLRVVTLRDPPIRIDWKEPFGFLHGHNLSVPQFTWNPTEGKAPVWLVKHLLSQLRIQVQKISDCKQKICFLYRFMRGFETLRKKIPGGDFASVIALVQKEFVPAVTELIQDELKRVDLSPLSLVTLYEFELEIRNFLVPNTAEFAKLREGLKAALASAVVEHVKEKLPLDESLPYLEAAEKLRVLVPAEVQLPLNDEAIRMKRLNLFKQATEFYTQASEQVEFNLETFSFFISQAAILLPEGNLSEFKDFQETQASFEKLLKLVMDKAKKEHVFDLKHLKEKYDPVASRLALPPMEINIEE